MGGDMNEKGRIFDTVLPRWGLRGTAAATIAARLTFENISHSYGSEFSLYDINLVIEPGEVVCLLGHSGCGKTTLLRVAAGIEGQKTGRVLINDREMAGERIFVPPEKRGVGLMFQDYALFPHMTLLANVMFGLTNLPSKEAKKEARLALARVGLEHYAEDYPHALSGGEQQRVALARAIAPRPSVLLMDEPFSGLDQRMRTQVRGETIALLRETRATCIIVTHDPEEAMRMADRIVLMRAGRIVQIGSSYDLYNYPADLFAARFFSELNELEFAAKGGSIETPFGQFEISDVPDGESVDICIRFSAVKLNNDSNGLKGRVISNRFLGIVDLVEIAVQGLEKPIFARTRQTSCFPVGSEVGVEIERNGVLLFSRAIHTI